MERNKWTSKNLIDFTNKIAHYHDEGKLPFALHLPGGNEEILIDIFKGIRSSDYVLSTHRNAYHALLHGLPEEEVEEKILSARSMFMFDNKRNFFVSAIIGGTPAIAVGIALALKRMGSKQKVWCFIGDGVEDTGHFAEAVRYVDGFDLPCKFIIEDDGMAVEVSKKDRWGSNKDINWPSCVLRYNYTKTRPHIRTGNFGDLDVMKSVMKSDEHYFPKAPYKRYNKKNLPEMNISYKEAVTQAMTEIGEAGGIFIGYSLIPGDAMGTLKNVPNQQKIETPITENLMVGMAIGASIVGLKPVVYFERHDFMLVAADAIGNHLDKIARISHGEFRPVVILKTVVDDGGMFYSGPTHSQDLSEVFKKLVQFEVLTPTSAAEALDMYRFALHADAPTMIVEKKSLHK